MGKGAGGEDRRHHRAGVSRKAVAVVDHPGVQACRRWLGTGVRQRFSESRATRLRSDAAQSEQPLVMHDIETKPFQ